MIKLNEIFNIEPEEMKGFTIALNNPTGHERDPLEYYLHSQDDFLRYIGWFKGYDAKRLLGNWILNILYNL